MMKKLLFLLLLPVASLAQDAGKEFKLKGDLKLRKPIDWVYLRYTSGDQSVTDSVQSPNGEIKFEGKIIEPTVATLVVKYKQQPGEEKAKREFTQIFLEPAKINIVAKDSLELNSVTGSTGHVEFSELLKQEKALSGKLETYYNDYDKYQKAGDKENMKKTEDLIDAIEKDVNEKVYGNFVKTHPNSTVALYALRQYAGWDIDANKVEPLYNSLSASSKAQPSAVALKDRIDIAKKTAIGKQAMDFTQNDTLGNPVSLSSFRGKYVLVDFWASWCGPCRRENPNVVKTFNKYKDQNFTILGVSLDRPNAKDKWLKAIHDDGLTWNHVSDLKFWDNSVAKEYAIRAIPQNILIDPQGKIVAKNLSGEELDKKLAELLAK
jgi:peroxiredoxin